VISGGEKMYKVMLIDDEPFITEGLANLLNWEEMGLKIVAKCCNGAEALSHLKSTQIDIVVSDIRMPNMTGLQFIEEAKKCGFDKTRFILLSGYDDFDYVKRGVELGIENYLLKPVSEEELVNTLASTVKKLDADLENRNIVTEARSILFENVMFTLLENTINDENIEEKCNMAGITDINTKFCVCLLWGQKPLLDDKLNYYHVTDSDYCIYVFYSNSLNTNDIYDEFKNCTADMSDCFVTVGGIVNGITEIYISYNHAKQLEGYRYFCKKEKVVCYNNDYNVIDYAVEFNYKELNNGLINKDRELVIQTIDDAFVELLNKNIVQINIVQNFVIDVLCQIISTVKESKPKNSNNILTDNLKVLFDDLYNRNDINDIQWWIKQVASECIDFILTEDSDYSGITKRTLEYVREKYNENINLKTVSAEFDVNSAYLGQIFKKETGENFTEHLNKIRILHAKEFLLDKNNYTNQEIAELVGYSNTNYFYTIFKNVTGLSPAEYRSKYYVSTE